MQNNPFISLGVIPDYDKGRTVFWSLDPTFKEDAPYVFTLQASEDPKFSELTFTKSVGDMFFAVDDSDLIQTFLHSYLYRVKLSTGSGNIYYSASIFFDGAKVDRQKYIYAAEIIRKETLRTQQYTGFINAWLLKRKVFASQSEAYLDPVTGVPLSYTTTDFGTGEQNGYYAPLKIIFSREDHQQELQLSPDGDGALQVSNMKARMLGFPLMSPYDILVTPNGERYTISSVQPKYFPGTNVVIVQNCDCKIIPNTDKIYTIPVPQMLLGG